MSITKRIIVPLIMTILWMTLAGCASTDPGPAFDDVQANVAGRTGLQLHWDRGTTQDQSVHARVQAMLDQALTAETAVKVALLNNPDLQATYQQLGIAQAELVAAGLLRNPVFSGDVKLASLAGGGAGQVIDMSVTQNFLDVLFIPLRKSVAKAELKEAKLRVTLAVLNTAGDVRRSFYHAQADHQLVEMMRQVAQSTQGALVAAQAMRDAGNVTLIDVDRHLAMYQRARVDLSTAQETAIQSRETLIRMMGLWGVQASFKLQGRLPEVPKEAMNMASKNIIKDVIAHSFALAADRAHAEALGRQVGLSGFSSVFDGLEAGIAAEGDNGKWLVGPGVSIPIPILNFGQAASAKMKARVREALWQYSATAVHLRSRTREALASLTAAHDRAAYLQQEVLPTSQRIMHQSQLRYNAMQIGVFQLLQAKQEQIDTGKRYIQVLRDYWLMRTNVDQTLAGAMPQSDTMASATMSR